MKVQVYCGMNIPGTYQWRLYRDWEMDYDECCHEFEIEVDEWDEERGCPYCWFHCEKCNALLEDPSHYELMEQP
jgi:hypothetical protein